jgi:protocatechuate 3,4-dioxygenase beta subunit
MIQVLPSLALAVVAFLGGLGAVGSPRGTAVSGSVISPDGTPVPKALVVVYPVVMGRGELPATTSTDARGRFRLEVTFAGDLHVAIDASGFAPRASVPAHPDTPVLVRLEKGRTLEGTVRDRATKRPVAGARVSSGTFFPFAGALPRAGRRESVTDASGVYRLKALPNESASVSAMAKGYATASATAAVGVTRADLDLPRGAWLSGTIRTAKGAPVKGAVVSAAAFESTSPAGKHGREETDGLGRFEIVGLTPGLFYVAAHHPGFAPAFTEPVRLRESLAVDLVLKDATTAIGRLVDADGRPAAGTIVLNEVEGGFPSLLGDALIAKAGPDGRFRLRDLPPGHHRAIVSARGHTQTPLDLETREGAEVDLGDVALASGLAIRGRIRDTKGSPIAGARIEGMPIGGGGGYAADVTDSEGAFALAGLGEGRFRLSLTASGVHRASREVNAGSEPIDWTVEPTGAVKGEVVDPSGQPVDSFAVVARSLGDLGQSWGSPRAKGTVGAFRIDGVPPGRYALRVSAPDLADAVVSDLVVEAEQTVEAGRIRLGPAGRVRGTVLDEDGRPVADAEVTTWSQRNYESGNLSHRAPQAHTFPDGSFEIGGLDPGPVMIDVHHARLGSAQVTVEVNPSQGPATARIALVPGGRLEGRVRSHGRGLAATVSAMSLSAFGRERPSVLTEEDGSFVFENLPPGEFHVDFRPIAQPAPSLPERSVWVRRGETTVLEVDFREILVRGRVTRSGAPAEGLRVAFDTEGRRTCWTMTAGPGPQAMVSPLAADGSYALLLAQPGAHTARVEKLDCTVLHRRPVVIPDAEEHRLDLEFTSMSLSGVLVDGETQSPIANGEVSVARKNSADFGVPTRTGPDGRFELPLEPGAYVLLARAPGYARAQSAVAVSTEGVAEQRLALTRGFKVGGRVVDTRGQGVAAVMLFATGEGSSEPVAHGQTAADGSFDLDGLPDTRCNLLAGSDLAGFAVQAGVRPGASDLVLTLRAPGRVRAIVHDSAGAPAAGAFFVITSVDDASVLGISSFFARTDGSGVAEVAVPIGKVELTAQHSTGAGSAVVEVRPGELAHAAITLSAHEASR